MLISNKGNTRVGTYDGFSTNLLIRELNSGSKGISMQITEVDSDGMQLLHSHGEEQCYYIIEGTGLMLVNEESEAVEEGYAVFVPSGSTHGIKNTGHGKVAYVTANQAFGKQREREIWPEKPASKRYVPSAAETNR